MKKILYIWKDKYPWDVRVEKFCKSLIDDGFDVLLLCRWRGEEKNEETINEINIKRVGFNKKAFITSPLPISPGWTKAITTTIAEFKPDIIITREFFLTSLTKRCAGNIPVLLDMAEHYPEAMKGWTKYSKNLIIKYIVHYAEVPLILEKNAVKSSDGIIVVSEELKQRLINQFKFDENNIVVVQNTPDLKSFDNTKKGVSFPAVNFAYHGYLSNDRNLDILVLAFIQAMKKNNNISLFIAGDGEPLVSLSKLIEDNQAADRIHLYGNYNQDELYNFLSETDVAILPYKNNIFINHIISNKLFDYMATGKPVIVSEAVPMKRIIGETGCGISADCSNIYALCDAILFAASNNLAEFSLNGMHWAEKKYNWNVDYQILRNFINKF